MTRVAAAAPGPARRLGYRPASRGARGRSGLLPLFSGPLDGFTDDAILALAYVVMALGLNIVVGFAGLLDLGYVAFYALGAYGDRLVGSRLLLDVNGEKGIHVGASAFADKLPGIHLNFLILVVGAIVVCAVAGIIIGLPTLRLRGDYIAIVTLAFGEIIGRVFASTATTITIFGNDSSPTAARHQPDRPDQPARSARSTRSSLRPYYWSALALVLVVLFVNFRLRDSRLGRAWIALREDEVAAASMGVPLVRRSCSPTQPAARSVASRALPGPLPEQRQRQPVPVLLLDLHPGHGHPRRARDHLGSGARRDHAASSTAG